MSVRVNYFANPSFETESETPGVAAGWSAHADTCTGEPAWSLADAIVGSGAKSQRIQYTGVAGDAGAYIYGDIVAPNDSFANGDHCTISGYIKGGVTGCVVVAGIIFMGNTGGAKSQGFSAPLDISESVTRFVYTLVATSAETQTAKLEFSIEGIDEGDTTDIYLDDIQMEKSLVATPYFDGNSPGCRWTGPANASVSEYLGRFFRRVGRNGQPDRLMRMKG